MTMRMANEPISESIYVDDDGEIQLFDETPEQAAKREEKSSRTPIEVPCDGLLRFDVKNKTIIQRAAKIASEIVRRKLKMPRCLFAMYIAKRVTGRDKQDFTMIMTGRKGTGKSYSSLRICQLIAIEIANIMGTKPEDYFTIDNCALLEDSEGINRLVKTAGMYQILLIDDAGVAMGSRDFATQKNKNFNKLLSTCRTKRWVIILNVPAKSHIDKQIRELVDCHAQVYASFHDMGYNFVKFRSVEINEQDKNKVYLKMYVFDGRKIDFTVVFSPDEATAHEYDIRRDAAAQKLIDATITGDEPDKITKTEQRRTELRDKYQCTITTMLQEGKSASAVVRACPGLSDATLRRIRADLGV